MHKLLTRFAWILSFVSAFVIIFLIFFSIGLLNNSRGFNPNYSFLWLIFITITAVFIKNIFFHKDFIQSSLKYFADRLKEDIGMQTNIEIRENGETKFLQQENSFGELEKIEAKQLQWDISGNDLSPWFVMNSNKKTGDIGRLEVGKQIGKRGKENELQVDSINTDENFGNELSNQKVEWNEKYKNRPKSEMNVKNHSYKDVLETKKALEPNALQKFFAENTMAKIWGILVFLAVLFFLKLIYTYIWDVTKLIIGFITGFALVGTGIFLDKKWLKNESMVMMGTWFLVNYLVILAGRYLLWTTTAPLLWETFTFIFLILNTILAVITSLVYKSPTLLLFSFVIAYINPFLIWANATIPYVLGWYAMIVSFGWFFLSNSYTDNKELSRTLNYIAILWGIVLLLLAPFHFVSEWMFKLAWIWIISLIAVFTSYRTKSYKDMGVLFTLAYISFFFLMWSGNYILGNTFYGVTLYISYMFYIIVMGLATIMAFVYTRVTSIIGFIAFPIILLVLLIVNGYILYIIPTLLLVTILLLIWFVSLFAKLSSIFKYGFFVLLAGFIFLISNFLWENTTNLWIYQTIWVFVTSIIFLLATYYFSTKKKLEYLYTLWSIATIFMILPLLKTSGETMILSIIMIVIFGISNMILPFLNTSLLKSKISNLSFGLIAGILFLAFQLYNFGELYFPGVSLWLAFLWLAVIYFVLSYFMSLKLEIDLKKESPEESPARNVVYSILGVSISLFSLAMVFVFSKHAEIISVTWLFEASILFFFYQRVNDIKIYAGAIVLFFIWILSLFSLIPIIESRDYLTLISIALIFGSLVANIKFLEWLDEKTIIWHDLLHLLWIIAIWGILLKIVPNLGQWWHILVISIFMVILWFIYLYYKTENLKKIFYGAFLVFLLVHILNIDYILQTTEGLPFLQYFSSLILVWVPVLANQMEKSSKTKISNLIVVAFGIYSLIMSTVYIYDIFQDTFVITMYWGVLTAITLFYGISLDKVKFRTIWLYVLVLTVGKILLIDIWYGLDEAILRVIALMTIGILMIVISGAYNKKYDGKMKEEFNLENLFN